MKKEDFLKDCKEKSILKNHHCHSGSSGAIYSLGVVGALFYFLQNAHGFSAIMVGIGKAAFWPALVVFQLLNYLHL